MVKNVFFDLDGTLISSSRDITLAINKMLETFSLPAVDIETIENIIGKGYPTTVRKVLSLFIEDFGHIETIAPKAIEIVSKTYKQLDGANTILFPNVLEILEYFQSKNIKMALVTNKDEKAAIKIISNLKLSDFFEITIGGDSTKYYKPHPLPLLHAMKELNAKAEESIMVGDSINDYLCANEAGVKTILISHGYNNGVNLKDLKPFAFIDNLIELKDLI
ncbi:HAD-IA family hydrolase [Francisella frigiditurris]|uniref:phosphoglycolate phosphatase n=1 Tax=Francisella frigiditurris TaxID=1542390 RepID=A0A1J0KS97_9GAMM|nr:HAD-IA family hydrolase [Francisella frigiditurris]APC96555.1 HAD hydrolase, IA, variant 1 family protein [Francisella frigiditurris]